MNLKKKQHKNVIFQKMRKKSTLIKIPVFCVFEVG